MRPPGPVSGTDLARAAQSVAEAAARYADLVAAGAAEHLTPGALADITATVLQGIDQATAAATASITRLDASGLVVWGKHRTMKAWLKNGLGMAEGPASVVTARAHALATGFTATRDAWLAGLITGDGAGEVVTRTLAATSDLDPNDPEDADLISQAEAYLLIEAHGGTVAAIRRAAGRLNEILDPQKRARKRRDAFDRQFLRLARTTGGWDVRGFLDDEAGALLATLLEKKIDDDHRSGNVPPADRPSDDSFADRRRRRLRRDHHQALALGALLRETLGRGDIGTRQGVKPHLTLLTTLADLRARRDADLLVPGHDDPIRIPADDVERLTCDAEISAILTGRNVPDPPQLRDTASEPPGGPPTLLAQMADQLRIRRHEILDFGRSVYTAPADLRRALVARDRHCRMPDCTTTASRCEPHHVVHWSQGGATSLANMLLLCGACHRDLHQGRASITVDSTRPGGDPERFSVTRTSPPARAAA